jgi:hypothetical protein
MTRRSRILLLFLLKAALIYSVFLASIPVLDGSYGSAYRACGTLLFGRILKSGFVLFQPGKDKYFTHISIGNLTHIRAGGATTVTNDDINTREQGYMHTILLIALVFASPVSWNRRLFAFTGGLFVLSAFVMLKLWLHILVWCEHYSFLSLLDLTQGWKDLLETTHDVLFPMIYPTLFFVVAVWVLLTFRKDDLKLLNE